MPSNVEPFVEYQANREHEPRCGEQVLWARNDDCNLAVHKILTGTMNDADRVVLHWITADANCAEYFGIRLRTEALAQCKGQA